MTNGFNHAIASQFGAALAMLADCLDKCPPAHWDDPVAKYPFWHVAYHTLCFVDLYLTPGGETAFIPRHDLHPAGWAEYDEEYPSRRFDPAEIARYLEICRAKLRETISAETPISLASPSGFRRLPFTRAELHLYNLRHLQHHTGQLSAAVRRFGADPSWIGRTPT